MDQFHQEILEAQRREGVRVIAPPHALGFLDPNLPPRNASLLRSEATASKEPSGVK
jgi:hypothetical protein